MGAQGIIGEFRTKLPDIAPVEVIGRDKYEEEKALRVPLWLMEPEGRYTLRLRTVPHGLLDELIDGAAGHVLGEKYDGTTQQEVYAADFSIEVENFFRGPILRARQILDYPSQALSRLYSRPVPDHPLEPLGARFKTHIANDGSVWERNLPVFCGIRVNTEAGYVISDFDHLDINNPVLSTGAPSPQPREVVVL